jgi:hypothetical protein
MEQNAYFPIDEMYTSILETYWIFSLHIFSTLNRIQVCIRIQILILCAWSKVDYYINFHLCWYFLGGKIGRMGLQGPF